MKRYTMPFQKLQLLVVYSSLATLFGVTSVITCTQAWGMGKDWPVASLSLFLTALSAYAALSTYRHLLRYINIVQGRRDAIASVNTKVWMNLEDKIVSRN
jgi:hypothetical protein